MKVFDDDGDDDGRNSPSGQVEQIRECQGHMLHNSSEVAYISECAKIQSFSLITPYFVCFSCLATLLA